MRMDATAIPSTASQRREGAAWPALALAHGLNALLGLAGLTLLLRGLGGRFSAVLGPWPFFAALGAMALLAAGVRLVAARRPDGSIGRVGAAAHYGPAAALLAALPALAIAGPGALWVLFGGLLVVVEEAVCWWMLRRRRSGGRRRAETSSLTRIAHSPTREERDAAAPRPRASPEPPLQPAENVVQQVLRLENADGTQSWQGWCRTRFAPSARHAVEHLSFCPPFLQTPQVHCRPVMGPPVRLRVSRVLPHGASVELRLASASTEATSVTFEFTATTGTS